MPYIYCPYCGEVGYDEDDTFCDMCKRSIQMQKSKNEPEYYMKRSLEKYGDTIHAIKIFFDEEASKNPLFDLSTCENYGSQEERVKRIQEIIADNQPPKPKCPTCGSTNIQKISDLRKAGGAIMFGLFSKTARSQFECKNCGMKF